ncbi:MAG TPA: hypothetical protein VK184_20920 [Nostocaceae cyanobacterium]|nr:hypothetical protein [Nostocaceae cyanobacterium]
MPQNLRELMTIKPLALACRKTWTEVLLLEVSCIYRYNRSQA